MSSTRVMMAMGILCGFLAVQVRAEWSVCPPRGERTSFENVNASETQPIKVGDELKEPNQFRWLLGSLHIPEKIDDQPTLGKPVGMRISCGDGGEVYVDGKFQTRYDNDHPALVLIAQSAVPGTPVKIHLQAYGQVQGGNKFDEAAWTLIDSKRTTERMTLTVDADKPLDRVPDGLIGLSQGGGLADYEDATAAKLKAAGFKWFRMDNILTNTIKKKENGEIAYDWADFDRRLEFIVGKMEAESIFAVSYMPIPLDAVENHERQSAPKDYGVWEDLCYRAAKRAIDKGMRVPHWEVWNEVNTGWLKPGPEDTGTDAFRRMYEAAVGKPGADQETVRRFEAYCKLYRATARGVRRADPEAKVGGPALASGPFEQSEYGFCANGKGFARGLMAWCEQEKLPLDFVSWHEYFHPSDIIAKEADAFREYLKDYPTVGKTVRSFMITEWNEAWWTNRPMDHEIGAAYCGDCVIRAFIPHKVDRPCFFYVKQNDTNFRGDFSMLMRDNVPKPAYHMAQVFNGLSGRYLPVSGTDGEVCAVAAWDSQAKRLAIVLVNFNYRYAFRRHVQLQVPRLPEAAFSEDGKYVQWTIDGTHSNVFHDRDRAELEQTGTGAVKGPDFKLEATLEANSVTLIELLGR